MGETKAPMFSFSSQPCSDDDLERSGQAPASRAGACPCVPSAGPPTPRGPAAEETLLPPRHWHDSTGGQQPGHHPDWAPDALWNTLYRSHGQLSRVNTVLTGHLLLLTQENVIFQVTQEISSRAPPTRGPFSSRGNSQGSLAEPGLHPDGFGPAQALCIFPGSISGTHWGPWGKREAVRMGQAGRVKCK